jgi:hypothetical protein
MLKHCFGMNNFSRLLIVTFGFISEIKMLYLPSFAALSICMKGNRWLGIKYMFFSQSA